MIELNIRLNVDGIESNFKYLCNENTKVIEFFKYVNDNIIPKMDIDQATKDNINDMVSYNNANSFGFISPEREMRILMRRNIDLINLLNYLEISYDNVEITNGGGMGAAFDVIDGVRFYTHSNEENHKNSPHIHTEYQNKEASYSLITGEKITGYEYPSKIETEIKDIILNNQGQLKRFWLDTTNGLWPMYYPFEIEIR